MSESERLHELSFDLYERYAVLNQIGSLFRPKETPYRVLDVGGHTEAFWPGFPSLAGAMIPDAQATVIDVIPRSELQRYVRGSGTRLPFRDGSFDLVCALDTLEHIPDDQRPAFLAELLRVTRDGLYVAFPFDSASNHWAESVVVEYTSVTLRKPVPALLEHQQFGLPDRDRVRALLSSKSHALVDFAQGNTDVWLLMMLTYHTLREPGTDFVLELNRRFNQVYASQDWGEPNYRAAYLVSKCRTTADLEAARVAFGGGGSRADLESVLSFCQLFLNIAQMGRVTVDKDRHIRNLTGELGAALPYRDKWEAIATALGCLEEEILSRSPLSGKQELQDWPLERLSYMREVVEGGRLHQRDEQLTQIGEQLADIAHQLRSIQHNSREVQGRFDSRMRDLEIGLVTNRRAVQAIYDSRIWKAFRSAGGLLLRMTGQRPEPPQGPAWATGGKAKSGEPIPAGARSPVDDFVGLVCDNPGPQQVLPAREVVEIRGWALAKSGINRILVQINDEVPVEASYGTSRPDVGQTYPGNGGAGQSGFRFFWDTTGLQDGPVAVRITAMTKSGQTREIICHATIDSKTPPGYGTWIERNEPAAEDLAAMRREAQHLSNPPLISVIVPVYKTPPNLLSQCIDSVIEQTYSNWELCLADDGSRDEAVNSILEGYARRDARIRVTVLERNRGISAATNEAAGLASGEFIAFLDHDDELAPFALQELAREIRERPEIDLFYSDEDKIDEEGQRYDAFFKPDWSPELFLSCNYICHFAAMKRSLWDRLRGLDSTYSGAQDYEFLLRATEHTRQVRRIPKVLYHWRAVRGSTAQAVDEKPEASADGRRALASHLKRAVPGAAVDEVSACRYRVRYPIHEDARVSVLIPTGGNKNVYRAVEEVLEKTSYKDYEIVLIDNSRNGKVEEFAKRLTLKNAPLRYFDWRAKPFNFSEMNNVAARTSDAPYLLFLNDDVSIIAAEWMSAMLELGQQPAIGAVGAQLWYPNNSIQHAGVVMGLYGNCSHAFKGLPMEMPHYYFDFPNIIRNCSAVTGACLLVGRDKFFQAGGFDEVNLAVAFQDVDLCLKLLDLGYRNVFTPYAKLYHYESATKTDKDKIPDPVEDAFIKNKWAKYISDDPYYNPNLARRREDFSLAID